MIEALIKHSKFVDVAFYVKGMNYNIELGEYTVVGKYVNKNYYKNGIIYSDELETITIKFEDLKNWDYTPNKIDKPNWKRIV